MKLALFFVGAFIAPTFGAYFGSMNVEGYGEVHVVGRDWVGDYVQVSSNELRLNGGGRVEPASKYDIHSLVRANFHSLSSGRIICEYQPINPMQHKLSYYRDTFIGWIYQ